MPKPAAHALTWCFDTARYRVCDPEHDRMLAVIFGGALILTPASREGFDWLATLSSFTQATPYGPLSKRDPCHNMMPYNKEQENPGQ